MSDIKNYLPDAIPLGTIFTMVGQPADGKYLPTGSIIDRSSYPELNAKCSLPTLTAPSWSMRSIGTYTYWEGPASNGSLAVAINAPGSVTNAYATTTDGVTWTARTFPASSNWGDIYYCNNQFIVISFAGTIALTSTDGITWAQRTLPVATAYYGMAYGNSTYVIVGSNNTYGTSTDGITWTARTAPTTLTGKSPRLAFGNNTFVMSVDGLSSVYTSTDGLSWTARTLPSSQANWTVSPNYVLGKFFLVNSAASSNSYCTSTDGITWNQLTFPVAAFWYRVMEVNGLLLAVAYGGSNVYVSSMDGVTWAQSTMPSSSYWRSVGKIGSNILVIGQSATNNCVTAPAPDATKMKLGTAVADTYMKVK